LSKSRVDRKGSWGCASIRSQGKATKSINEKKNTSVHRFI
jgi:hypothetical protein